MEIYSDDFFHTIFDHLEEELKFHIYFNKIVKKNKFLICTRCTEAEKKN